MLYVQRRARTRRRVPRLQYVKTGLQKRCIKKSRMLYVQRRARTRRRVPRLPNMSTIKETDQRNLWKRPMHKTYERDLWKRPMKETYERDLWKRPIKSANAMYTKTCTNEQTVAWLPNMSKETHKRGLWKRQIKETYERDQWKRPIQETNRKCRMMCVQRPARMRRQVQSLPNMSQ